jgi:hypothetical protein
MPDSSTLVLNLRARLSGAWLVSIRLGWKCLSMTNALAYSAAVIIIFAALKVLPW